MDEPKGKDGSEPPLSQAARIAGRAAGLGGEPRGGGIPRPALGGGCAYS